jgi:NAD(P)-dependent dehydrogenase (short-subunit alcohol dehydrogenase family)
MSSRQVVCVTGASAGVGRAVALAFAATGARVGLIARSPAALAEVAAEVERRGGTALALPCDVAESAAVQAAADQLVEAFGGLDIWVNDAMVTVFGPVSAVAPDEVRRVTEVTYLGTVHGTLAALRHMRPRDAGTIIQIGSALAYRSIPLQAPYCAAKAAVRGFTDSLRCELRHDGSGIRVTMLQLPAVNTPQFDWARSHMPRRARPVAPVYQPEAIARHVVAAARHPPRELWIGRMTPLAILGNALAPGLADRFLASDGVSGQMTDERERERPDNLMETVDGLHRTHGRFDDESQHRVGAVPDTALLGALLLGGAGLLVGLGLALRGRPAPTPPPARRVPARADAAAAL